MSKYAVNIVATLIFLGIVLLVMGANLAWIYVIVKVIMYALGLSS